MNNTLTALLSRQQAKTRLAGIGLLAAVMLFTLVAVGFGRADIGVRDAAVVIYGKIIGNPDMYSYLASAKTALSGIFVCRGY